MSLKDELNNLIRGIENDTTDSMEQTLDRLSEEDKESLNEFMSQISSYVVGRFTGARPEMSIHVAILFGFILGHNWVKDHWVLW